MKHRPLNESEITALQNQGCFSSDWSRIRVTDPFSTETIHHTCFLGEVSLGHVGGSVTTGEGETRPSGLYNCTIDSCEIGNDVLIDNVQLLKNYRIMDHVIIEHVHAVSVNGTTSFGNGFEIEVLNEGGGRELMLFDRLTAQLAYILVSYRHDPALIGSLNGMIKDYASEKSSGTGTIGNDVRIINARDSLYMLFHVELVSSRPVDFQIIGQQQIAMQRESPCHFDRSSTGANC